MNVKKYLLSVLAEFFGLSVAFFVLEEVIFNSYRERNFYQSMGVSQGRSLLFGVIPMSMALIMAYLYPKVYDNGSPAVEGLQFGTLLGLFSAIPFGTFFAITFALDFVPVMVEILIYTVEIAVGGLIIGLVYGKMQQTESLLDGS
jgi:heme O synthase-like polyprenyltransferase